MVSTRRIDITLHALSRWRERRHEPGQPPGTDDAVRLEIGEALLASRPVRLKNDRERAMKAVLNDGLATYHQFSNVVLVLTDNAIVSVYEYDKTRWEKLP